MLLLQDVDELGVGVAEQFVETGIGGVVEIEGGLLHGGMGCLHVGGMGDCNVSCGGVQRFQAAFGVGSLKMGWDVF